MLTVSFSVGVAIVANRYSSAILRLWQDGAADTGAAHVQFHAAGYWQKQEGVNEKLTMAEGNAVEVEVRKDPRVDASSRRLRIEGMITAAEESLYFVGIGVEPENEMMVSPRLFTGNDKGEFVREERVDGITIGVGLAESLSLKIGDEVTLITQTLQGSVNGVDAVVIGIVDAGVPSFSKRSLYANIKLFQKLIRMPGRYTELGVRLDKNVSIEQWVKEARNKSSAHGVEARGWWDIEPIIKNVEKIWDSVVGVIASLLFLSAGLSVLNIIFMLVAERTVEIGTLMAIGARGNDIRGLFALEASLIGVFGGIAGCIGGNLFVLGMDIVGVPFKSPFGSDQLLIHPKVDWMTTLIIFVSGVIICRVASISPARKAAMVEPVRAFRGQIT